MGQFFTIIVMIFHCIAAHGEYRAYELQITNDLTGKSRTVISTLDHIQYPDYHPLESGEIIKYVTSWMCWDRTGDFRPICPNPKGNRVPATNQKPKTPPQ